MDTVSIDIVCFAVALAVISGSISFLITKVNTIENNTLKCLKEIQDIHREMYHWFDVMGGETRHTRKIVEEIDKRI